MTPQALQLAIRHFEQANGKDPKYALSYAGVADCYAVLAFYGFRSPAEAYPKAQAAALKALELDDGLAEAHTALAHVKLNFTWDWAGADRELRRAVQLNPSYSTARMLHSVYLARMGRFHESLEHMQRARELDPLALTINTNLGLVLYLMGRYDEALEQLRKSLEIDPNFLPAHISLGWVYERKGMLREAVAALEYAHGLDEGSATLGDLGRLYARSGREKEAHKILHDAEKPRKGGFFFPFDKALVCIGLNRIDEAFKHLEQAYEERAGWRGYLRVDPRLEELRSDPRFEVLAERMGLSRQR